MSYQKAADLLQLALEISAHRFGMAYSIIDERSDAPTSNGKRRNTQRMLKALERVFGARLTGRRNESGEMCVFLTGNRLAELVGLTPHEMAALDRAIDVLSASNDPLDAENLRQLRTKIRLLAPVHERTRLEVDYEALLETGHVMARPGPSPKLDPTVMRPLTEALLAMKQVTFSYRKKAGGTASRTVHPYGVIFGTPAPIWWQMTMMLWRSVPPFGRIDRHVGRAMLSENGAPASRRLVEHQGFSPNGPFWCLTQ